MLLLNPTKPAPCSETRAHQRLRRPLSLRSQKCVTNLSGHLFLNRLLRDLRCLGKVSRPSALNEEQMIAFGNTKHFSRKWRGIWPSISAEHCVYSSAALVAVSSSYQPHFKQHLIWHLFYGTFVEMEFHDAIFDVRTDQAADNASFTAHRDLSHVRFAVLIYFHVPKRCRVQLH